MIAYAPPDWIVGVLLGVIWFGTWIWIEMQEFPSLRNKSKNKKGRS
jgi:hypothetical protein